MPQLPAAVACLFAFCFGSIPFGFLVSRFYQKDITRLGSGNIGATNVTRVLGLWPAGVLTFALDFMKGVFPVVLLQNGTHELSPLILWSVAFLAIAGHCFSPWLKFQGGKGVATAFGAIVMLSPWAALAGMLVFVLTFLLKRTGSVSSLSGLTAAAVTHLILTPWGAEALPGFAIYFLIVLRHEANIDALLELREKTF